MIPKRIMQDVLALADLYRPTWAGISAAIERSGAPTAHVTEADSAAKRLKEIDAELRAARDERRDLQQAREDAKAAWADADADQQGPQGDLFKAAEDAVANLGNCDDHIDALQKQQLLALRLLGRDPTVGGDPERTPANDPSDPRGGWDASKLFQSEDVRHQLTRLSNTKAQIGPVELGQVVDREHFIADVTGTEDMRRAPWYGVLPQLRRVLRVLSLIPIATMDQNILPYTKESGSFTTAAGTLEGATKPEGAVTFTDATAEAKTIAHWMKIRKQSLSDFAALRGIIDARLRYGVERKLEELIVTGKGVDPELEGILHTTGLGVVKYNESPGSSKTTVAEGTYVAEQILRAITTIYLADAVADGALIHPTDWQTALLSKAIFETGAEDSVTKQKVKGGSGQFVGGGPFGGLQPTQIWGLPLIPTASMKLNEVLVGDFAIGCQLFVREGVNVLMSDADQDDFVKNRITLLAEMRAALAVWRPAAFSKVWLTETAELLGN